MSRLSIGEAIQQVVGVLSNVGDTEEVLRAIAAAARQMMLSDEAYLLLREGGSLVLRAADGLPQRLVGRSVVRLGEGIEGWVADHGEAIAVSDVSKDRRFRDLPGREARVRALAVVPMKLRDDVVGVLATAAGMDPFPPVGSRLTALEILGSIGAVTLENNQLLGKERRRAYQAEMLLELSGIQDLELQAFLQTVAGAINSALAVDDTDLVLLDDDGRDIVCSAHAPRSNRTNIGLIEEPRALRGMEWASEILSSGQPLLCDDVARDPRLQPQFQGTGVRSLLAVPVQVQGRRRGILRVATGEPERFRPEDVAFLTLIAAQVGLSVERADLARRQLEISREQARQQAKHQFLGLVSHELKTPVAVLKAYTELLARRAEIEPGRDLDREVLGRMLEQTDRMLAMIEQTLDLQRIESGQFSLEMSSLDLTESVRRVVESVQLTSSDHRIVLNATGKVTVTADRRRIDQVLVNLMENAVKFSPRGSEITVSVEERQGEKGSREAAVAVEDRGVGIAGPDLPRVFERYFQGRGRLHRGRVGLGLGLNIAREIVEHHGGKIWVEFVEGHGSIFYFTLPLASPTEEE